MMEGNPPLLSWLEWFEPHGKEVSSRTEPGIYQLYLQMPRSGRLVIGKLGTFAFSAGLYVYTGSALGGVDQRVARHLRTQKQRHWHIDYLLEQARIQAIAILTTEDRLECTLHGLTMERLQGQVIVRGFGSSDCHCPAHLGYLGPRESGEVKARFRDRDTPSLSGK